MSDPLDPNVRYLDTIDSSPKELLQKTDWYVIRFIETGTPIPQEITDLRTAARLEAGI